MVHQIHFGRKFYLDKKKGYWISVDYPRVRAHVWVWKKIKGSIPKDHHIHHIDENKSNNSIDNLQCLHKTKHLSIHASKEEVKERSRKLMDQIRPLTKKWHASEEGRKWHSEHGKKTWINRKSIRICCLMCHKQIETKVYFQKFCHQNCKAKYGRRVQKNKKNSEIGSKT